MRRDVVCVRVEAAVGTVKAVGKATLGEVMLVFGHGTPVIGRVVDGIVSLQGLKQVIESEIADQFSRGIAKC